ncbi:MAG: hypothetical protein N2321_05800 [Melioribacteraceae bacterium]|nr:hypothetical protein [Melioribacteraceae bacterium]
MNKKNENKIFIDKQTLFNRIKNVQKLPDEVVSKFLETKGKLKKDKSKHPTNE